MQPTFLHNLNLSRRGGRSTEAKWLHTVSIRGGLTNALHTPPVIVDNGLDHQPPTGAICGRQS